MYPSRSSLLLISKLVIIISKLKKVLSNKKHIFILFILLENVLFLLRQVVASPCWQYRAGIQTLFNIVLVLQSVMSKHYISNIVLDRCDVLHAFMLRYLINAFIGEYLQLPQTGRLTAVMEKLSVFLRMLD